VGQNRDELVWPDTESARFIKGFFVPMMKDGIIALEVYLTPHKSPEIFYFLVR